MSLRPLAALVAASGISLWLTLSAPAGASIVLGHANLISSEPGAGSVVVTAPSEIRLVFSEPIEARGTSADVLDSVGHAVVVEQGAADATDPYTLIISIPTLADGAYTVQWRSLSAADGHVAQGFFTFAVGAGSSPPPVGPGTGPGGDIHAGHTAGAALVETLGRAIGDAGTMLLFGLAIVALIVVLPLAPALGQSLARATAAAAVLGSVGTLLLAIRAADDAALPVIDYLTGTRSGALLAVRAIVLLAGSVATLLLARRSGRMSLAAAGAAGLACVALLAASGHSAGFETPLPIAAMVVHVASAGAWLAGLLILATLGVTPVFRPGLFADIPPLTEFVPRFSAVALVAAALFGFTGLAFAGELAGGVLALDSAYGSLVALKVALALGALGLGGLNFLARRAADGSPGGMRWRIPLEAAVVSAVVVVSALLASGSPPAPQQPVALAATGVGQQEGIALAIEPARPGPQRFVATVTPPGSSAPMTVSLDLQRVDIDQGTSRVPMRADPALANTWVSDGGLLVPNSSWTATVIAFDPAGGEMARQRFQMAFDSQRLISGAADRGLSLALLCGLTLLGLAVLALTMGMAGASLPRTPDRLGRAALLVGGAIAGPLGLILVFAWSG